MDLIRNMQAFACVAGEMSYTSAARALNMSTGSVSRLISELERHLATRLLHRSTRKLALTEAGRLYLARCRAILEALSEAEAEARCAHLRPSGRLKVRASPSLGRHYLIPAFKEYQKKYPQVRLALTLEESANQSVADGYDTTVLAIPTLRDSSCIAVFASKRFLDAKVRTWLDHLKAFLADMSQDQFIAGVIEEMQE